MHLHLQPRRGHHLILTLYADDLLVIGGDILLTRENQEQLMKFKMTDMGDVSLMLGMQITRDWEKKTLTISQEYTKSILERFGMANCKPVGTPGFGSEVSTKKLEKTLLSKEETQRYQAIKGSVMYLAHILRYDIMYGSGQLARAMSRPTKVHMGAAKHLLRYLAGTCLLYTSPSPRDGPLSRMPSSA